MKFGINTLLFTGTYTDEHVKNLTGKFKDMGFDGIEVALEKKGDIDYKKTNGSAGCRRFAVYDACKRE